MNNIILLGPQGSGKGTQGKKLAAYLKIPHISTGAMLRAYVESGAEHAEHLRKIMDAGELIEDSFLEHILTERLKNKDCAYGFILDGTPRDLEQAELLDSLIQPDHVFLIDISEEESYKRIAQRAQIEGREDDTPEALKERLHTYTLKTVPVLEYYNKQGKLHDIDGMGSIEEVYNRILTVLEQPKQQ